MAITKFIPEIWSASLLVALRDTLTYAQTGIINRNYEGDVARAGDTVHIVSFNDPSVRDYSRNGSITWDLLTDTEQVLTVAQSEYFAFKVDDLDTRQALPGFVEEATRGASYNLAVNTDSYVSGLMVAGVAAGNKVGDVPVTDVDDAYDLVVELRTKLQRSNVPADGRFLIVPPELYAVMLHDDRFIRQDASGTTDGLRNGQVGKIAGFNVIESNVVPSTTTTGEDPVTSYSVLAGHSMATTFVEQISKMEALRLQDTFADGIKGLHLYDAKVIRPTALASANVSLS